MDIALDDFTQFLTVKKKLSPNSVRTCLSRFKLITKWFKRYRKALNRKNVEKFIYSLRKRGLNNNTLNTYLFALKYIEDYLSDRGNKIKFMQSFTSFPKVKPQIVILTSEEIQKLIYTRLEYGATYGMDANMITHKINLVHQTLTMFLAYTGCRFQEASLLKVKWLDLEAGKATFVETKNKETRVAYLPKPLVDRLKILTQGLENDKYVFRTLTGNKMIPQCYNGDLKKRAQVANIRKRVYPHLFRHSFATQLLTSGVDLTLVATLLGHKDIQTTFNNYVHLADEALKQATYRHPLIRETVDANEIIKLVENLINSFKIETDRRFEFVTKKESDMFAFTLKVKPIEN